PYIDEACKNCPDKVKKLGRENTANGCTRQQRARGALPFSLLHQKRREISGWLTQGNRVN
ncbi:hypothetical protein, partial [Pseudomonas aeruginosa]|uniref:hypothetical protein n=1 Tax=Pseudomonas aeruginosa TaxID=287 RepID=UPI001C72DEB6